MVRKRSRKKKSKRKTPYAPNIFDIGRRLEEMERQMAKCEACGRLLNHLGIGTDVCSGCGELPSKMWCRCSPLGGFPPTFKERLEIADSKICGGR